MTDLIALLPLQQAVADDLLDVGGERPIADLAWAQELSAWIEEDLADHASLVGPGQHRWGKGAIASILGCEAHHLASVGDFSWTSAIAKGTIVHQAIALVAAGSEAAPRDLAYAALDQAASAGNSSLRTWLDALADQEKVALVGECVVGIDGFLSAFPPLQAQWRPVAEWPVSATIAAGKVRIAGRVDLSLGAPRPGPEGIERRRLIVEVKSGAPRPEHRADHLLYSLLDTLRSKIPPWRAATFYTQDGTWVADDITEELLVVAAGRLIDAVKRLIEVVYSRVPARRVGWRCQFCSIEPTCPARLHSIDKGRSGDDRPRSV